MFSTIVWAPAILTFSSPRPVAPAEPTSGSVKQPAPMIGESPIRPGIFHARPLVLVAPEISPRALTAEQCTVPVGGDRTFRIAVARYASRIPSEAAIALQSGSSRRAGSAFDSGAVHSGAARPGPQES